MPADLVEKISLLRTAETMDELAKIFASSVEEVGMSASASGMLTGPRGLGPNPVHFRNWDPRWLDMYESQSFITFDPLIRYPMISGEAASWTEIYGRFPARDPGHAILAAAAQFGYRQGFVTPVRTRDGSLGLVSVGGDRRVGFSTAERLYLESLSTTVLRHAEELLDPDPPVALPSPLSMRERECIGLIRLGLTDREIAQVLRVSPATIRGHIDQARIKLGAKNRTQLAVMVIP